MKDLRAKRSPPGLPPLASTQLPYGSQPPCLGFPHAVWLAHIFREISGVCEWNPRSWLCLSSGTGGSLVRNRLGSPIRVPTLSGNRRSAHRQGLGFPPLKGLGARALYPSALPAGLPLVPYKQAALSLVRTPMCMDQEQSSNKIYTGRPLGGHVLTLPGRSVLPVTLLVDTGCAPLSSCPRWLIRYLVGAVCPSRGSTGTFCHGGVLFHCATSGSTLASMRTRWASAITLTLRNETWVSPPHTPRCPDQGACGGAKDA